MQAVSSKRLAVRLAADPVGVPAARRFVVDGLAAWAQGSLAEAAELVISELAGNVALHAGARFMYVVMETHEGGIRVSVEDDGPVGAEVVAPHLVTSDNPDSWAAQATTGRGLAIVSMVSEGWGVTVTPRGKCVWADVIDSDAENEVRPPTRRDTDLEAVPASELPPGWVLVRLARCPVELSLRQDDHLDELVRELQLIGAGRDNPHPRAIAEEISELLLSPAHARLTGRRLAEQARAEGRDHVDIDMAMPREFSGLVQRLHRAVGRADELCEQNELLTLASPPELRSLREWMTHEIVAQAEHHQAPSPWTG